MVLEGGVMKAITLWPEWAWAICCLNKRVENRGWHPGVSMLGEDIAIHDGKCIGGVDRRSKEFKDDAMWSVCDMARSVGWAFQKIADCHYILSMAYGLPHPEFGTVVRSEVEFREDLIPTSAIIATAVLDKVTLDPAETQMGYQAGYMMPKWGTMGAKHWHLTDVSLLDSPVSQCGSQRLWNVPRDAFDAMVIDSNIAEQTKRWKQMCEGCL